MIRKLELENFQGYKKASVEFSPGINVITGENDQGKSSIIRALNYLGRNRPTRNNFINDSKPNQTLKITGTFDNGVVSRLKGKSKNQYIINNEQPLKALKTEVPDEVQEITQLKDVNFQEQGNPYFLLSLTPGAVAKEINKVANLEVMDKLLQSIKTEVSDAKRNSSFWTEKVKEFRTQAEELKWVEDARIEFDKIKKLNAEIEKDSDFYNKAVDLSNTVIDYKEKLTAFAGVEKAISALETINKLKNEILSLQSFRDTLLEKQEREEELFTQLKQYNDIDKAETALKSTISLSEKITAMNHQKSKLIQYKKLLQDYTKKKVEAEKAEKTFKQSLKVAGICPFCETKF